MTLAPPSATAIPAGLQNEQQHSSTLSSKVPSEVDVYAPQDIICLIVDDSSGSGAHGEDDRRVKEQTLRDSTTSGHLAPVPHLQQGSGERVTNPHRSESHIGTHPNKSTDPRPDVNVNNIDLKTRRCLDGGSHVVVTEVLSNPLPPNYIF